MAEAENIELGMIELEDNLSQVEKPPELPPGKYVGEVQEVSIQTSGKGNQYFSIKFVIPSDEIPADIAEHYDDGAVLYWNRNIVPNGKDRRALFNLRKLIEALGLNSNTTSIDPNEWMGCKARLTVVHGKWQGETRAELKALDPAETKPAAATGKRGRGK
jgi:hypothetical protein